MNTLVAGLEEQTNIAFTENGAVSNASTLNPIFDFFTSAPSQLAHPDKALLDFKKAYAADERMAIRTLLWLRDARGGAGARAPFRACLKWLAEYAPENAIKVLDKTVEVGRWDDVISVLESSKSLSVDSHVFMLVRNALAAEDFLCAKWMPRKGNLAYILQNGLRMSPKFWRKTLVKICAKHFLVETKMCANDWDIPYEKVPGVAFARYKAAFKRHNLYLFEEFLNSVNKGQKSINAGVVFPHDIVHAVNHAGSQEQWNALPNYMPESDSGLVVCDVSGSMEDVAAGSSTAMDVSISMAIYMAERAHGPFKDTCITFSSRPEFVKIPHTLSLAEKVDTVAHSQWDMNTDIQAVFKLLLDTAKKHKVPESDMPKFITIISDMQFDACGTNTNLENIKKKYAASNYNMPKLIFWNVGRHSGDKPLTVKDDNVVLVAGFSPAILKTVFSAAKFNPLQIFLNTILDPRYDFAGCKAKVRNEI